MTNSKAVLTAVTVFLTILYVPETVSAHGFDASRNNEF